MKIESKESIWTRGGDPIPNRGNEIFLINEEFKAWDNDLGGAGEGDDIDLIVTERDGRDGKKEKWLSKPRKAGGGGKGWQPPTWETEKLKIPTMNTAFVKDCAIALVQAGQLTDDKVMDWIEQNAPRMLKVILATAKKIEVSD